MSLRNRFKESLARHAVAETVPRNLRIYVANLLGLGLGVCSTPRVWVGREFEIHDMMLNLEEDQQGMEAYRNIIEFLKKYGNELVLPKISGTAVIANIQYGIELPPPK